MSGEGQPATATGAATGGTPAAVDPASGHTTTVQASITAQVGGTGSAESPPADGGAAGAGDGAAVSGAPPAQGSPPAGAGGDTNQGNDKTDWRMKRIATLTAQLKEEKAKNAASPPAAAGAGAAPQAGTAEFDAAVAQAARAQYEWETFNNNCNAALAAGRAAFPTEFDQRLGGLLQLVDQTDRASLAAYQGFLAAAIKAGSPEKIIHELGGDLNEAMRVMSLGPIDMAIELAKRSVRLSAPAAPAAETKVPAPPSQSVGGKGSANESIDPSDPARAGSLPSAEWHKRRQAQLAARAAAGRRY